jgi:hypothetical protein
LELTSASALAIGLGAVDPALVTDALRPGIDFLARAPRVLARTGVGVDGVATASERGVPSCTTVTGRARWWAACTGCRW